MKEETGLAVPDGDYRTLGGFLIKLAGAIPPTGSVLQYRGVSFTVESASPQAIDKVRIRW